MDETENLKQSLRDKIKKCDLVLDNLSGNPGFLQMLEDFKKSKDGLDEHWHLIRDPKKLEEMQLTKCAVMSVLNILKDYEHDKQIAKKQLFEFDNPDLVQSGDYSPE